MKLKLSSPAFLDGQEIPSRHVRDGQNLSPPLRWEHPPKGTRELAVICEDPDAPGGEPFSHWVVYRIKPSADGLPEGMPALPQPPAPQGVRQGVNSAGKSGYVGPAPPPGSGLHHYVFRLCALDAEINPEDTNLDRSQLLRLIRAHVLAEARLVGTRRR